MKIETSMIRLDRATRWVPSVLVLLFSLWPEIGHSQTAPLAVTNVRIVNGAPPPSAPIPSAPPYAIADLQLDPSFITVPTAWERPTTFQYGGILGFNPVRGSLYVSCHVLDKYVGEITIPESGAAALLQPCSDVMEGRSLEIFSRPTASSGVYVGGLLAWKDKVIHTAWEYYDADNVATKSHFVSSSDLTAKGDVKGPFSLQAPVGAGMVAKYMALVPQSWQPVLGVPALTGMCCESIIGRTSFGPSLFGFDPDQLGLNNPVRTLSLLYYDVQHQTLGTFQDTAPSKYWNGTTRVEGVVWPENSRTVFFFGYHGTGEFCYGPSTNDIQLKGTIIQDGSGRRLCYEPEQLERIVSQNSTHAYPYSNWVWAYDALDIVAVASGQKAPWEIKPFDVGPLSSSIRGGITGATYDPATDRIFVATRSGDTDYYPRIHIVRLRR